jgi:predicted dehydrogenase/threonine dehydrogenase-like Zn-dependent dehydrogenase
MTVTEKNRQVVQDMKTRSIEVLDGLAPEVGENQLLVRIQRSLVSAGTELNTVNAGSQTLLKMARARPDLVRKTLQSVKDHGLIATTNVVRGKLESLIPLGYSNVGVVENVGEAVLDIKVGERVACAGASWANHSDWCAVPRNLVARVPSSVTDDEASITTVAAIAMHGFRQSGSGLGDRVGVIGLGLIGLLSVQIALAAGAEVYVIDPNKDRVDQAVGMGANFGVTSVEELAKGDLQLDSVLVCAHSGDRNLLNTTAALLRPRGSVVLVGNCEIHLDRDLFFSKELRFSVSRSYGPGRYDLDYEELGISYPLEYVRWTQTENMKCVLSMLERKQLHVDYFPINRFPLADARSAYDAIKKSSGKCALTMFTYDASSLASYQRSSLKSASKFGSSACESLDELKLSEAKEVSFIGLGSHAQAKLVGPISKSGAVVSLVVNASMASSTSQARALGRHCAASSVTRLLASNSPDVVFIATRHNTHAPLLMSAAKAGKKAIFLEKPLAITRDEINDLKALEGSRPYVHLNLNRRYSPALASLKHSIALTPESHIKDIYYEINMPPLPVDHWTLNKRIGGGPLLGEACHFVDFCNAITGNEPISTNGGYERADHSDSITPSDYEIKLSYPGGCVAHIIAVETTAKVPKEIITNRTASDIYRITDFRKVECLGLKAKSLWRGKQDKGFEASITHFFEKIRAGVTADDFNYYLRLTDSLMQISTLND